MSTEPNNTIQSTHIHIKRATPALWPETFCVKVKDEQRLVVPPPHTIMRNYIFDRTDKKPGFDVFLVLLDQQVIGLFSLALMDDNYLWFGGFQVDQAYQHRGVGTLIFQKLMRCVRDNERYAGIKLDVHCLNRMVMLFYQTMVTKLIFL